jgi:hypothetical protein
VRRLAAGLRGPVLGIIDQTLTSVTSIVVVILAARKLDVGGFGSFALLYTLGTLIVGAVRAYQVEPQLVIVSADDIEARRLGLLRGLLFWLRVAACALPAIAVAEVIAPVRDIVGPYLALALLIIAMGTVDTARFRLVGTRRLLPAVSANICVLLLVVSQIAIWAPDSFVQILLVMAASYGVIAVIAVIAIFRPRRGHLSGRALAREVRHSTEHPQLALHSRNYATEFVIGNGSYYLSSVLASSLLGLHAAAGIRGTESLLGPARILITVLPNALLATSGYAFGKRTAAMTVSAVVGLWAVAFYVLALVVFHLVGNKLYGDSADAVGTMLPLLAIGPIFMALSTGPIVALRSLALSPVSVRVRTVSSAFPLVGSAVGSIWGIKGVALGLALASAAAALAWWTAFLINSREREQARSVGV